jgi:SAM-dependent methyltransferase
MNTTLAKTHERLITHKQNSCLNLDDIRTRLITSNNLTINLQDELDILKQLTKFELGEFLLKNKGLNGYWTSYVIIHGLNKNNLHPLENWLLHKAPAVKATQERYNIFKQQLQKYVKNNFTLASIPCGLMDDLLSLNYSDTANMQLVGIDLDLKSLQFANNNAKKYHNENVMNITFFQKDAWDLNTLEEYDIITSNGLNIYERDEQKVINLYREFYKAIKPGGILITSFLTPPTSQDSTWKNYSTEDMLIQKAIFCDILQATWQVFRTEEQTRRQLEQAGFRVIDIIYDLQCMFPTVVAKKTCCF